MFDNRGGGGGRGVGAAPVKFYSGSNTIFPAERKAELLLFMASWGFINEKIPVRTLPTDCGAPLRYTCGHLIIHRKYIFKLHLY